MGLFFHFMNSITSNFQDKNVFNTDINNVMVCVAHDGNTIDKEQFNKEELKLGSYEGPEIDILNKILCIK